VRWACSAQLDLLGFSNHLMVANCDIRTQTGAQAIERLSSLEKAIQFFEQEKSNYPDLYPRGLEYLRFNDAIFLGIDVKYLNPPTGRTSLTGGYSIDQLRKRYPQEGKTAFEGTTAESGGNVAKFLGLVSRIHEYINKCEAEKSFPGCRTVVASGLRKCFKNRKGIDDFFSANFSISTAFEAGKMGSSVGLEGNHLYVEDDIAMAISYCDSCYAIMGFAKFFYSDSPLLDPYNYKQVQEGSISLPGGSWIVPKPISLDIMKKHHTFRRLNPNVLTNLQLFKDYERLATESKNEDFENQIYNSLSTSTPSLEEVNNKKLMEIKYPFLFLNFNLDANYSSFFS
jgi:hypothetical protein